MASTGIFPRLTEAEAKSSLYPTGEQAGIFFNKDDQDRPYTIDSNRTPRPISDLLGGSGCSCPPNTTNPSSGTMQVGSSTVTTTVSDQEQKGTIKFNTLSITASQTSKFEGSVQDGVYYLNVIADSSGKKATKLFASVTKPDSLSGSLPTGYDLWRHIGMLPIATGPTIPDFIASGNRFSFKAGQDDFTDLPNSDSANITLLNVPGGTAAVSYVNKIGVQGAATDSSGSDQQALFGYNATDAYEGWEVPANSTARGQINIDTESGGIGVSTTDASTVVDSARAASFEFQLEGLL